MFIPSLYLYLYHLSSALSLLNEDYRGLACTRQAAGTWGRLLSLSIYLYSSIREHYTDPASQTKMARVLRRPQ